MSQQLRAQPGAGAGLGLLPKLPRPNARAGHGLRGAGSGFIVQLHARSEHKIYLHSLQHAILEQSHCQRKP